ASPVPVTLKTRLGPDHNNYTLSAVAAIAESLGIELITVHGRTRACRFNGQAQFDEIAKVKSAFPHLAVIANGDINSVVRAEAILHDTGCDGLMIGRSSVGNPWLFSQLRRRWTVDFQPLQTLSKSDLMVAHIAEIHAFYGQAKGVRFARKHIQAYLQHLGLAAHFAALATLSDAEQQLQQLQALLAENAAGLDNIDNHSGVFA
ncbi:MAG: tRNA dihydrouridine synthase DusB, partial [Gammaproteobacteria bacterium]